MLTNRRFHFILLGVVCFFTFFVHNRVIYPDIMESRNLVTAREMVEYKNWLVPTMNGELRLEKPPLPTWIAAFVEMLSPDDLVFQRAMSGVMATFLVFFLYMLSVRMTQEPFYGLLSALVLCTSFNIILMGRTASWDIYCHSFMLAAIYFLFRAFEKKGSSWGDFTGAGILMGLSFLGKGPVSFYALLLPFLLVYFPLYRPSLRRKWRALLLAVGLCLIISLWWPLYIYVYHHDEALYVAAKESGAWMHRSVRPWYYYWKFFLESGIWSLFLVTGLMWFYWKKRLTLQKAYVLSVGWTFAILVLLSFLPEKKTRYLLPILIPSAMVVGHLFFYAVDAMRRKRLQVTEKRLFQINMFVIASIIVVLPVVIYFIFYNKGFLSLPIFLGITLLFEGIGAGMLFHIFHFHPFAFLSEVVLIFTVIELFLLPPLVNVFFNNTERKSIAAVRKISGIQNMPFYYPAAEELRIELIYEARCRILPLMFETDTLVGLPFIYVSAGKAENYMPHSFLKRVNLKLIDVYDDNRRPRHTSFYSSKFIRYVTLVTEKEMSLEPKSEKLK